MRTLVIFVLALLVACGPPQRPSFQTSPAAKDAERQKSSKRYVTSEDKDDEEVDRIEKDTLKALGHALGKNAAATATPAEPSSAIVTALRDAKIKLRLEVLTNEDGKAVNDSFFVVNDSYTDHVKEIGRKASGKPPTPAEARELQTGMKFLNRLMDLKSQVSQVSIAAMSSNSLVQQVSLGTMLRVSSLIRQYKLYGMELDESDYALVKRTLDRQTRAASIAAATMGMLAAYQAVMNSDGDPKALDIIAEQSISGFPIKPSATIDDAKSYVKNLGDNVAAEKARYEASMRKVYGDAKYEKRFKASFDAMFAQAASANSQKSVGQMMDEKYTAIEAKQAAAGGGADGSFQSSVGGVGALMNGDAKGAINFAIRLLPVNGVIKSGLSLALGLLFK